MDTQRNYIRCAPQDLRCVIARFSSAGKSSFSNFMPWLRMVLHPKSPFAQEVGILFPILRIENSHVENLLIESRFFERFGNTVDEIYINICASPLLCNQIKRYCCNLKVLNGFGNQEGLWDDAAGMLSQKLEKLMLVPHFYKLESHVFNHRFPKLLHLEIRHKCEPDLIVRFLEILGKSLLYLSLRGGFHCWDDIWQGIKTHCPKLENFEGFSRMPIDKYYLMLRHYGAQVRTASLECFIGRSDLCQLALEACPNLRAPSYCSRDFYGLQVVASRLNGFLQIVHFLNADYLNYCMKNLVQLRSLLFYSDKISSLHMDCLADNELPFLKSLRITSRDLVVSTEVLRKMKLIIPQLRQLSIASWRLTNQEMWVEVFAKGVNLEELTFLPRFVSEDKSAMVMIFRKIVSAVRKHSKLSFLHLIEESRQSSHNPIPAEIREAVQVFRHKRVQVKFKRHILVNNRVPALSLSYVGRQ